MTDFREELSVARDDHRAARYPGDLARELLPASQPRRPLATLVSLAGGAIAAAAVLMIVVNRPLAAPTPPLSRIAQQTDPAAQEKQHHLVHSDVQNDVTAAPAQFALLPEFSSRYAAQAKGLIARMQTRVTTPYRDIPLPAMPELPSLDDLPRWNDIPFLGGWPRNKDASHEVPPGAAPATQQSAQAEVRLV